MTNSLFDTLPIVSYNKEKIRDITRRAIVDLSLKSNPFIYLPYTIVDDERPEDLAFYYYDDPELVWLVYLANNIVDPYNQWPLSNSSWEKMMIKKYQSQANTTGYQVIDWTRNQTITSNILYYTNKVTGININIFTYNNLSPSESANWTPYRIYQYEMELNDAKRNIQLIDKRYVNQAMTELKRAMNG